MAFNRYHKWLGISPKIKRPTYYQLLGVDFDEEDIDVIQSAAEKQRSHVQQYEQGTHHEEAAQLISELDDAELTLLSPNLRKNYNRRFYLNKNNTRHSGIKSSGGRTVGEGSGLFREYAGIMSVILGGFIIMAAASFLLPWQKLRGDNQEKPVKPATVPDQIASMESENRSDKSEKKEEISEITYTVEISPPDAQLRSEKAGVIVSGEGRQRKIIVSSPNEIDKFTLNSSRIGFEYYEHSFKTDSNNRNIVIRLEPAPVGEIRTYHVDQGKVTSVVFSKDGKSFVTAGSGSLKKDWGGSLIKVWDTESSKEKMRLRGHKSEVTCLAISPDNKTLASGCMDKTIHLWDLKSGQNIDVLTGHTASVQNLAYTPNGETLVSAGSQRPNTDDESIRIWNLSDKSVSKSRITPQYSIPRSLTIHPDGKRVFIATAHKGKPIHVLDIGTADISKGFNGHKDGVYCLAVAPSGQYAISGSATWPKITSNGDNSLRLWDCNTGREIRKFQGNQFRPFCVAFSPDGQTIASGDFWYVWKEEKPDPSIGCSVRIWDVATGRELHRFKGHTDTITSVSFSPDGRLIASSSYDGTVRFWRTPN